MGAIAEGIMAYAQPLIDQTDGSIEQVNKALTLTQLCFNLALLPEVERKKALSEMQLELKMDVEEFADFRRSIIDPMIRRHSEMFPRMHQKVSSARSSVSPRISENSKTPGVTESNQKIDRYAPCPCGSGEKYKFCCGSNRR